MERFDCPIHSGPLVVVEDSVKDCGCPVTPFIHHYNAPELHVPFVIPAACLRGGVDCRICGAVGVARLATRHYVEEAVPA